MRSCVAAVSKEEDSLGERITVLAGQVTPVGTFRWHGSRWRGSQAGAVACCWLKNGGHWRHWKGDRARRPRQRPVCLGAKPRSACAARAGQRRTCTPHAERRQNRLKWAEPGWIPWCVLCSVCSVLHPKQVLFTLPANTHYTSMHTHDSWTGKSIGRQAYLPPSPPHLVARKAYRRRH